MEQFEFQAASEHDTDRLGGALARHLPETCTVALLGTLGAGKTRLVQAIADGSGIDPQTVTSPTFVLCQPYHGDRTLYHLDAYRVKDLDEFLELGVEEYFEAPGITLIEWADRVALCLPDEHLEVNIEIVDQDRRVFTLIAHGGAIALSLDHVSQMLH